MSMPPGPAMPGGQTVPTCASHPDRVSYVRCQRCGQPACPSCQHPAAVGIQCTRCVQAGQQQVRPQRTVLGGRASSSGRPVVTWSIIALCVLVWLGEILIPRVFFEVAFVPALGDSQPWRLLSSAFAHSPSAPFHLAFNMFALYLLGRQLELALGWARYLALYLAAALAGGVAWLLLQPVDSWVPVVGASGAVFGLFGAYFVLARHLGRDSSQIVGVLAINAVLGFVLPNVAWQAHLGGLLAGLAVAAGYIQASKRRQPQLAWATVGAVLALTIVLFVAKYALG